MSRRALLLGALSAFLAPRPSLALGSWGGADLADALAAAGGVSFGPEAATPVDVLVSPGCDKATRFVPLVLAVPDVRWRFVPFDPRPSLDSSVGRFLREGGRDSVLDFCRASRPSASPDEEGARQRTVFESKLGVALYRATGRTPAAPSMVADLGDDGLRVFRGAPDEEEFAEILAYVRRTASGRPWDAFPALFPRRG